MRYLKVAAASLNQTPLDWEHNKNNILSAIHKAREMNVTLLCCPELCITGYGSEDMFLSVGFCQMAMKTLLEIVPKTKGMIVAVGLPILFREGLYNTACVIVDGKISGFAAKQHLANTGVHYETRWFKPWPAGACVEMVIKNQTYFLGDLIFDINQVRIGFEICEDAWVAARTGVGLAERGVDIILNPSASHFAFGKSIIRKRFVEEGARAFSAGYIYANLLGNEAGRIIYDGDTLIAAAGTLLAEGPRFSFQDNIVTTAVLDIENLRMLRSISAGLKNTKGRTVCVLSSSIKAHAVEADLDIASSVVKNQPALSWETSEYVNEEAFVRAVALGLFDYMRKSRSKGFVLNLSGGADSSACACLVYLMVHLSIEELGIEGFQKKLPYLEEEETKKITKTTKVDYINHILKSLLFCLYQRTENNSSLTLAAATELSKGLGCVLTEFSIDKVVNAYCDLMQPIIGRTLEWKHDDIALQNVQARVRGPSAWLLANVRDALLLCTSNRSEAAVGYTTMDGDTCGGLSPIAGVDKNFILQWLKWLEEKGIPEVGPIQALKKVNQLVPSAELRPQSIAQMDETDLMPYDLLDAIERLFVRNKCMPEEILIILRQRYPNESPKNLCVSIERFFQKWARNQWKRERIAPSFHLDDESVDPKTWCRFPILSVGFKEELEAMWRLV